MRYREKKERKVSIHLLNFDIFVAEITAVDIHHISCRLVVGHELKAVMGPIEPNVNGLAIQNLARQYKYGQWVEQLALDSSIKWSSTICGGVPNGHEIVLAL
jgi:hypothetical protein